MNAPQPVETHPWWKVAAVGRNPWVTLVRLGILVALTLLTFRYVLVPIRVTGISMNPTYRDGERHWVSPLLTQMEGLKRGDVVSIQTSGRHVMYLKRILGLPGEQVRLKRGHLFINGERINEPYVVNPAPWNWPTNGSDRVLGPDEYLVVGDNRSMPAENHFFGVTDRSRILGKVVR
ncbi:MAG TPA: signal peptidase I [Verrucomicrobiota bacterium]|nr:signal peptidase I [Verrucomicrobiales bacterium]HRI13323.1 signal peptidase I [Verrucomicrobiota bacterium]